MKKIITIILLSLILTSCGNTGILKGLSKEQCCFMSKNNIGYMHFKLFNDGYHRVGRMEEIKHSNGECLGMSKNFGKVAILNSESYNDILDNIKDEEKEKEFNNTKSCN